MFMWYSFIDIKQSANDKIQATVKITEDSSWFAGHFPGDPILPGIVQLEMVVAAISRSGNNDLWIQNLSRIKFKKIIRPGEILSIQANYNREKNNYSFQIMADGKEACTGVMNLANCVNDKNK